MKNVKAWAPAELSSFCMELSLLLHAGYPLAEGLHLLREESKDPVLAQLCTHMDHGASLSAALRETGAFPDYLCSMAETGELTGRLEQTFASLSSYYERKRTLARRIRGAVLYPTILLTLMLVVIAVLLTKVLPVFNDVFEQLGGQMTGLAGGLLAFGEGLDAALPWLGMLLLILVFIFGLGLIRPEWRARLLRTWERYFGDGGIARKIASSHFAAALTMGLQSGLSVEESLRRAIAFQQKNESLRRRMELCLQRQEEGRSLSDALLEAQLLPPHYCRMLSLALRSGTADSVMEEIARRMEEDAEEAIDAMVSRVEPSLVLLSSVLVGILLLSVMLPLMNIMSAIG